MWPVRFFLAIFPCHSSPSYAREDHIGSPKPESVPGALLLHCHVKIFPARIAINTTALIVAILLPSYEESVNMSRCILIMLKPPVNGNEMPSRPKCMNFQVKVFAETSIQPYNVL